MPARKRDAIRQAIERLDAEQPGLLEPQKT
jgi:hypothetical protein